MKQVIIFNLVIYVCTMLFVLKNYITFKQRDKINSAIHKYNKDCVFKNSANMLKYSEVTEQYSKTLFRLWDCGYKRIVSKDIFEKIEKYI